MWRKLLLTIFALLGLTLLTFASPTVKAAEAGTITVHTIPDRTLGQKIVERAKSSWPWYVTRASGLVAAGSLVLLLLSGIGQITGHTFRFLDPLTAWASHRALGITFGLSVLVHIGSLLFDHFVQFNFVQLLVPWASSYHPVSLLGIQLGSLYVALGIFAFYCTAIIIITSLLWVEKKPQTWKWIHLLSYVTIALVFIHALFLGTDLAHGILRTIWMGVNVAILLAALLRLRRAYTT